MRLNFGSIRRGNLCAFGALLPCSISLWQCTDAPPPKGAGPIRTKLNLRTEENALAGGWGRGTREKLRMPVTNDRTGLEDRSRSFNLNQNHHCGRRRNRRGRVHDDAQWAMVGITLNGVNVRYLHNRQQRKQDETHHGSQRPGTKPGVQLSAEAIPQPCQTITLSIKNTHNWMMLEKSRLHDRQQFLRRGRKRKPTRFV